MGRICSRDGILFRIVERISDLFILNMLWTLCCLPVVTVGASTSALYACLFNLRRGKDAYGPKTFFREFRANLRAGTAATLSAIVIAAVILMDYLIVRRYFGFAGFLFVGLPAMAVIMTCIYLFPILCFFRDPFGTACRNAFLMSLRHFGYSVLMLVNSALPLLLTIFFHTATHVFLYLWIVLGTAGTAYLNSRILLKIFERYIPEDQRESYYGDGA